MPSQSRNARCAELLRQGKAPADAMRAAGFGERTIEHSAEVYPDLLAGWGFDVEPAKPKASSSAKSSSNSKTTRRRKSASTGGNAE